MYEYLYGARRTRPPRLFVPSILKDVAEPEWVSAEAVSLQFPYEMSGTEGEGKQSSRTQRNTSRRNRKPVKADWQLQVGVSIRGQTKTNKRVAQA